MDSCVRSHDQLTNMATMDVLKEAEALRTPNLGPSVQMQVENQNACMELGEDGSNMPNSHSGGQ